MDQIKKMTDGAKQNWIGIIIFLIPLIGGGYVMQNDISLLKVSNSETRAEIKNLNAKIVETNLFVRELQIKIAK